MNDKEIFQDAFQFSMENLITIYDKKYFMEHPEQMEHEFLETVKASVDNTYKALKKENKTKYTDLTTLIHFGLEKWLHKLHDHFKK